MIAPDRSDTEHHCTTATIAGARRAGLKRQARSWAALTEADAVTTQSSSAGEGSRELPVVREHAGGAVPLAGGEM